MGVVVGHDLSVATRQVVWCQGHGRNGGEDESREH